MRTWWMKLRAARQTPWWLWFVLAVMLVVSGEVLRRQHLNDQQVARLIQIAGLLLALVTALTKVVAWTRARLRGIPTEGSAVELLKSEIFRREESSRYHLLADTTSANLAYSDGSTKNPGRLPLIRRLVNEFVRYQVGQGGQRGNLADIGEFFDCLPVGRLIILGDPGSGKTMMCIELALQLLKSGTPDAPLPIRLSLASWDGHQELENWLADRLVVDYGIRAASAKELVAARPRKLLPILDGLDEMDRANAEEPSRALQAIRVLNEYIDGQLRGSMVLTCRSERFAHLESTGATLRDATKIRILPLQHTQIVDYIEDRFEADARQRQRWLNAVNTHAEVMDEVLSTPWRLHLAATLFNSDRDPDEMFTLNNGSQVTQSTRINEFLLDSYVTAAILKESKNKPPRYPPEKVEIWLKSLAKHLTWQETVASKEPGVPAGLSGIDLVPHLLWPIAGQKLVRVAHVISTLSIYYIVALGIFGTTLAETFQQFVMALDVTIPWVKIAITVGLYAAVLAAFPSVIFSGAKQPWPTPWVRNRVRIPPKERLSISVRYGGRTALSATRGGLVSAATLLGLASASNQFEWPDSLMDSILTSVAFIVFIGTTFGIILGLISALVNGLSARITEWNHDIEIANPHSALRFELIFFTLLIPLGGSLSLAAIDWIAEGRQPIRVNVLYDFLAISSLITISLIPARVRYTTGILLAAMKGMLPLRLFRFLSWSCDAGLLRRSGVSYQFRHLELQNHLIAAEKQREVPVRQHDSVAVSEPPRSDPRLS
ncbi:NACHT domain-containing NTPase [Amycolatopsis sp. Hca4]|uniref:NACHT domain-containing protein n=1 Tax=Amycolatopsis sp. Hca4 TaxID=2742131 RepID=UPI001592951F|nr:NACHT domain-containing protein [Amycolatopsis sp. Hca4]QKV77552.1 NACHT domain-containing protein [Amycolatopsis sp. Hca4]